VKPINHHGANPALQNCSGQQVRAILKLEARLRASGDWGDWESLTEQEYGPMLSRRTGWVRDVRKVYRNRVFSVLERLDATGVIHAGIASLSGIRPTWYEMQRIKDELFGRKSVGVEIYPAADDLVDGSDMFHLWILPADIPFGLTKLTASRQAAGTAECLLLKREESGRGE